jgi:hypothetical protein
MPISSQDFDKGMSNSPLLQFLKDHPDKAYSLSELHNQFQGASYELQILLSQHMIIGKHIINPQTMKHEAFFRINIT